LSHWLAITMRCRIVQGWRAVFSARSLSFFPFRFGFYRAAARGFQSGDNPL
jgi:hypothetical protein